MIKFENTEVMGWEAAIRGMRNPMNSWDKSDSGICFDTVACHTCRADRNHCKSRMENKEFVVGYDDMNLMTRLRNAGTDHRKFMRMITVYVDITAPLYWWKEFDTYKVGTVANSCSTMHKIAEKKFERDDFSHEHLSCIDIGGGVGSPYQHLQRTIVMLNECLDLYLKTMWKMFWLEKNSTGICQTMNSIPSWNKQSMSTMISGSPAFYCM